MGHSTRKGSSSKHPAGAIRSPKAAETIHSFNFHMGSPLTTHVLDTSVGRPAAGLRVRVFYEKDDGTEESLNQNRCDENGRVTDLLSQDVWKLGIYRIRFFVQEYFSSKGIDCFYPYCDVTFTVRETESHYHVPLLLSPYGYSTYRGS